MKNDDLQAVICSSFNTISTDGAIGAPSGELSYAYVRVSSSGQAEEGRSGLPRQLANIHDSANKQGLRIPLSLVYYDDHTGFEFRDRPGLQLLLAEITRPDRQAHHVTLEYLDRLSRNAKWHQGFLLDMFVQNKIAVHFWKSFGSEIERAVMGAISEQGMHQEIERMARGTRHKAESGRVTAKTPAYGYLFADSNGRPSTDPTSQYRKDTNYVRHPDEAPIVQEIFQRIIMGDSLYRVCDDLNRRQVPTPKHARFWETGNVSKMLKNPVYKGQYVANRFQFTKEWSEHAQRMVRRQRIHPESEWITVNVPPLVSEETWEGAQLALKRNIKLSTRNTKESFLLQGFLRCSRCGRSLGVGSSGETQESKRRYFYLCSSRLMAPVLRERLSCHSPYILRDEIDPQAWAAVTQVITDPDLIIQYLEEQAELVVSGGMNDQLAYVEREIQKCEREESQWDRAFAAEIFSLAEYRDKKTAVAVRRDALLQERIRLEDQLQEVAEFEAKKELVRQYLQSIRESGFTEQIPLSEKRRILSLLLDRVIIDTSEGWFRLEGAISGTYPYGDGEPASSGVEHFGYLSALSRPRS